MNDEERAEEIGRVTSLLPSLGRHELRLVFLFASRIRDGQDRYGFYDPETEERDLLREEVEETVDAEAYRAMRILRRSLSPRTACELSWEVSP